MLGSFYDKESDVWACLGKLGTLGSIAIQDFLVLLYLTSHFVSIIKRGKILLLFHEFSTVLELHFYAGANVYDVVV